jgi:hypothetical protein
VSHCHGHHRDCSTPVLLTRTVAFNCKLKFLQLNSIAFKSTCYRSRVPLHPLAVYYSACLLEQERGSSYPNSKQHTVYALLACGLTYDVQASQPHFVKVLPIFFLSTSRHDNARNYLVLASLDHISFRLGSSSRRPQKDFITSAAHYYSGDIKKSCQPTRSRLCVHSPWLEELGLLSYQPARHMQHTISLAFYQNSSVQLHHGCHLVR